MSAEIEGGIWLPPITVETCERVGWVSHMDRLYRRADTVVDRDVASELADAARENLDLLTKSVELSDPAWPRRCEESEERLRDALAAYEEATEC